MVGLFKNNTNFLFTEESIQEWYTLKKQSCPPRVNILFFFYIKMKLEDGIKKKIVKKNLSQLEGTFQTCNPGIEFKIIS
jgi:hypothetical protein